jgi:hypothetical protein
MKLTIRLLILIAAASSLHGCVVFTFGEDGMKRVPTAEIPAHLKSQLEQLQGEPTERTARNAVHK